MNLKTNESSIINAAVFFTSFSLLGYEIVFTRVFAYSQWHNLSSLIITMALLGFGASGTAAALYREKINEKYLTFLSASSLLFPAFLASGFFIPVFLEFNPYEIALNYKQVFNLFIYFILTGIPFFFGASVIFIAMIKHKIPATYFFNLSGSGAGALAAMAALYIFHPYSLMLVIIITAFIPFSLLSAVNEKKFFIAGIITLILTASISLYISALPEFKKVSQYKSISGALNLPGAGIKTEKYSPLAVVQVVEAEGLRSLAGLSISSPYQVPVQIGIFFDGDSMSSIAPFNGDIDKVRYIKYLSSYLPYYLQKNIHNNRLLIIGSGGGESILKSILAGFKEVHAVEADSNVISLMKNDYAAFSGNIYNQKNLTLFNADGRSFIRQSSDKYDLIEISLLDTYNTSASGVYALNETYLYTTESFLDYYSHLEENGILSVTRWITTPPKDSLKLFNTAIESLSMLNTKNIEKHIAAIRSLQTVTLLISKNQLTAFQISGLKKFCDDRCFDIIFCPGIERKETNRYIKLTEHVYYYSVTSLLSDNRYKFVEDYDYDISAPDDDRPYFYNFFKPRVIEYIKKYGPSQMPVTEWGYLILLIILLPVIAISFISVILPVIRIKGLKLKPDTLFFFSLIASGYFFIEMPLIQKMVLFLGHPSYSISVIISGLLIFSGTGSFFSDRIFPEKTRILISTILICVIIMSYLLVLDTLLAWFIQMNTLIRIMLVMILIAPPAFFMGFPFPQGLNRVRTSDPEQMPLAWGVNGFFSVISIITASLIAVIYGFRFVFFIAALCYIAAGIISVRFYKSH